MSDEVATLKIGEKTLSMPVHVGTENDRAIDISKLLKETGHITLDEGYANTGAQKTEKANKIEEDQRR
ncbi:MAG: hypothetical protein ACKO8U_16530 [Pirellula sp.]